MRSAELLGPNSPAVITQEAAERVARAVIAGTSDVVRRERAMVGGTGRSTDLLLGEDHRGQEIVAGIPPQRAPEVVAGPRDRSEAPDDTGHRESSGAGASSGNGAGEPPSPPTGGGSGADGDDPFIRMDLGGPDSPALPANAETAALTRDSLTAKLRDWSSPGYVDDIARVVGDAVENGRGTVRVTAGTVGRPDGTQRLGIEVTHTDASEVRTIWELDQTPGTVERPGPGRVPAPRPEGETTLDGDDRANPMWGRDGKTVKQDYQEEVGEVRRSLEQELTNDYRWLSEGQVYDAQVALSELYTNGVTYSPDHKASYEISARGDDAVRISVSNNLAPGSAVGMAPWIPDQQSVDRLGGRGTQIIHETTAACGREIRFGTDGSNATHWFEFHRPEGTDGPGHDPDSAPDQDSDYDPSNVDAALANLDFDDSGW